MDITGVARETSHTTMDSSMIGKLLDTTVLIDLSRGNTEAASFVDTAFASNVPLSISVISANDRHFKMISGLAVKRPY